MDIPINSLGKMGQGKRGGEGVHLLWIFSLVQPQTGICLTTPSPHVAAPDKLADMNFVLDEFIWKPFSLLYFGQNQTMHLCLGVHINLMAAIFSAAFRPETDDASVIDWRLGRNLTIAAVQSIAVLCRILQHSAV